MCKNTSNKKDYHFYNVLFGVIVILLLVFGILNLIKDSSNIAFTSRQILDYVGLFFTVTGAVTALYFIIMGVYVYRTQRNLEEYIHETSETIDEWEKRAKEREISYYNASYRFYSDMIEFHENDANLRNLEIKRIKSNGSNIATRCMNKKTEYIDILQSIINEHKRKISYYKLQQARLACSFKAIDGKTRANMIEILGTSRRDDLDKTEIEKDIQLLQNILDDDAERDLDVRKAAEEAISELKKKL